MCSVDLEPWIEEVRWRGGEPKRLELLMYSFCGDTRPDVPLRDDLGGGAGSSSYRLNPGE